MDAVQNNNHLSEALKPLENYKQFILYKLVPSTTRIGKTDKIPVDPATMRNTNAHNPAAWNSYDVIKAYADALGSDYGVGFVFTENDPFYFLDIDECWSNGDWSEMAKNLCACLPGAAVEVSSSGTGLHVIGTTHPVEHGCKNGQYKLELYTKDRFVALTDNNTTGNCLTDSTQHLQLMIDYYFPPAMVNTDAAVWNTEPVPESNPIESDDELIAKALKSRSGANAFQGKASFSDLWLHNESILAHSYPPLNSRDPYDRSSADAALAQQLAFWTGKNHDRINRLMWKSGLAREKWTKHKSYLTTTICNAVSNQLDVYTNNRPKITGMNDVSFDNIFILPSNHYPIVESAKTIFTEIAEHKRMFVHGGQPVELKKHNNRLVLGQVTPDGFRSRIESYGKKTMAFTSLKEDIALKPKLCTSEDAKALLSSKQMIDHLPNIRAVMDCAVLSKNLNILDAGYHNENGGLLITKGNRPVEVDISQAVNSLLDLFIDFEFLTESDRSRAVAMVLTPALKMGGFIESPCPVDVSEADESQSGKTYRLKLNAAIYDDAPIIVALKKGGVGSIDESIATALASGRPFIMLDNFRGMFDSTFLEAAITTPESVPIRLPKRMEQIIDARIVTFQLSSNGVNTTKDMANRSCMVRIRKKQTKLWHQWSEGDLIAHVKNHQAFYLGCIFSVVREWVRLGCQKTQTTEHDMIQWAQSLDWIVQNIFQLHPLLDGHKAIQNEISNPNLVWIRSVCIAMEHNNRLGVEHQAHDISELCDEADIKWPGDRTFQNSDAEHKYVGTIMGKLFDSKGDSELSIDNYTVTRLVKPIYDNTRQGFRDRKVYTITRKSL